MHPPGENGPSSAAETGSVSIEESQYCSFIDSYRTKEGKLQQGSIEQASLHHNRSKSSSTLYQAGGIWFKVDRSDGPSGLAINSDSVSNALLWFNLRCS
jgi:hypothetical protein